MACRRAGWPDRWRRLSCGRLARGTRPTCRTRASERPGWWLRARPADQLLACDEHGLAQIGRGCLGVDPDERLGPARADEQPRPVGEEELEAIVRGQRDGSRDRVAIGRARRLLAQVDEEAPL